MEFSAYLLIAATYLLGGLPSGYLIAKAVKRIDIRKHGSGNPGAANVYRVVGRGAGLATLIGDVLKGFLPVLLARGMFPSDDTVVLLTGAAAIAGHIWMVFLRFNGGKGVATTAGVFLALMPAAMLPTLAVFVGAVSLSGHISIGSMAAAAAFPFLVMAAGAEPGFACLAFLSSGVILVKHIPNLRRILKGEPVGRQAA